MALPITQTVILYKDSMLGIPIVHCTVTPTSNNKQHYKHLMGHPNDINIVRIMRASTYCTLKPLVAPRLVVHLTYKNSAYNDY